MELFKVQNKKIAIVVVLYNPTKDDVNMILSLSSIYSFFLVDNTEFPNISFTQYSNIYYVCNNTNLGIAEAQNIALREILKGDYEYVVFLDQDTRVAVDYPLQIAMEFSRIDNGRSAVLGPQVVNAVTGGQYASAIHKYEISENGFSLRKHIISSGSCMSINALKDIGLMWGELFIDYVDFEWCWRAASKGYQCGVTSHLQISHHVGQRELSIGKYKVIISAQQRYFYQYRNFIWLIQKKYVPLQWKCATCVKFLLRLVYFPILVNGGLKYWNNMIKGLEAGIWQRK